jgi:diguanylate cyclase (GGDEF)-like protein/PAS domain S-box-containing protein
VTAPAPVCLDLNLDFYRSLIETMEEGVLVIDAQGRVLAFNSSLSRVLGLTAEELEERSLSDTPFRAFYEDGSPVLKEELPATVTLKTGMPLSGVVLGVPRPQGGMAWVSVNSRPLQKAGEKPHAVICTFTDISTMKTMEKLLKESEGRLRSFIREVPVGILVTNELGYCVSANHAWCEMAGLTSDECQGQGWTKAVHPDDSRELFLGWKRLVKLGMPVQMEFRFVQNDGSVVWVDSKAIESRDDSGSVIGYLWTVLDVTEAKKTEEERDRLFMTAPDLLCIATVDGYFKRVNPSFTRVLGFTPEELLSRPILDLVHPEDKGDTQDEFAKVANGYDNVKFENRCRCKDGSWRWVSWTCPAPVDGLLYIAARDHTERKRTEDRLLLLAHTDQLTGLANRATLMAGLSEKLSQAEQYGSKVAVLFIDLDEFKEINDIHGHDAGDLVIKEIASRLKICVRRSDIVARLGGDEYVVVLERLNNESDAEQVAHKILSQVSEPFELPNGIEVIPKTSIGIAMFPADGKDPEKLVKAADKAMYVSKRAGGHRYG